jgi:chemotaxis protein CheX
MTELNKEVVDAFVTGTKKTLSIQCSIETIPQEPFLKGTRPEPEVALTGIIGMTSSHFSGNVHLSFSETVFLAVMNQMLGEKFSKITDDLTSGAAELLNIIYGSAKTILTEKGYKIKTAIPTVIHGHLICTKSITSGPTLVLPFTTQFGDFFLEITAQQN